MKTDPRVGALRPKDAARYLGIGMETLRTSSVRRDEALFRELVVPTYESRGGKVVVEAKEVIRKRLGGATPDRADAVVYGNWVRSRAAAADPEPREGQHPWYQKRGGVVERIGRKLEHDQALREFYERGGYLSGLEGRGFRVNPLPGDDWPDAP
jgi:hypothetical protein